MSLHWGNEEYIFSPKELLGKLKIAPTPVFKVLYRITQRARESKQSSLSPLPGYPHFPPQDLRMSQKLSTWQASYFLEVLFENNCSKVSP